jgi:hypothetical protein
MPSVDMFLQHHKNPKAYMVVLYEFFLKSIVGPTEWIKTLGDPFEEASMISTPSNEAFTL